MMETPSRGARSEINDFKKKKKINTVATVQDFNADSHSDLWIFKSIINFLPLDIKFSKSLHMHI